MVAETKAEYPSEFAAIASVARKLGIATTETLRKWIRRAEIDVGQRPGVTIEESRADQDAEEGEYRAGRANDPEVGISLFRVYVMLDRPHGQLTPKEAAKITDMAHPGFRNS